MTMTAMKPSRIFFNIDNLSITLRFPLLEHPIMTEELLARKTHIPNAPYTEPEAGHFLQEEISVEIAAA